MSRGDFLWTMYWYPICEKVLISIPWDIQHDKKTINYSNTDQFTKCWTSNRISLL